MAERAGPASRNPGGHLSADPGAQAVREAPRRVSSAELLGHARELMIEHAGEIYRLRATSKGKLILTK
jgi:hemin uptake protein HemP